MPDKASESADRHGTVTWFFRRFRSGDRAGASALWEHFAPRLLALAQKHLGHLPRGVLDAEDAVQSAFGTFFKRVGRGEYSDDLDRRRLWKLLGVITAHKAFKQVEREHAQKRGGGNVVSESDLAAWTSADDDAASLDQMFSKLMVGDLDLVCEEMLCRLDNDLRQFVLLRLMGYKNREMAEMMRCTERKVERKLQLVRQMWEQHVAAELTSNGNS